MHRRIRVFEILKRERNNSSDEPNRTLPILYNFGDQKKTPLSFHGKGICGAKANICSQVGGREGKGREGKEGKEKAEDITYCISLFGGGFRDILLEKEGIGGEPVGVHGSVSCLTRL